MTCRELEEEKSNVIKRWGDKYNKELIQIKMNYIVDDLVAPMIEKRKLFYENYYNTAIWEKREIERRKLQKKFKDKQIVLGF